MAGSPFNSLKALGANDNAYTCADLYFGTGYGSSSNPITASSDYFTTTNLTISSLSIDAASSACKASKSTNCLKLGSGSTTDFGGVSFTFSSPYRVLAVFVQANPNSAAQGGKMLTVSTTADPTGIAQKLTYNSDNSFTSYSFTGFASTEESSWFKLALPKAAIFQISKIILRLGSASLSSSSTQSSTPSSLTSSSGGDYAPITFNFVEQGNAYSGDCTYIKAGDNDILIDAGNRVGCASTIESYLEDSSRLNNYVSDGKLEYVIATHAHQDHIAGFVGVSDSSSAGHNGILYHYSIGTLIDFARSDSTSAVYANYQTARTYAVNQGSKHFTALQCWNNEGNGASRSYSLGQGLSMQILYNYYYENASDDENNYSVCVLFTQGSKHFLLTGDLEADGETRLVANNTLPQVELFKGGHHGSYTANTGALLSVIRPQLICICACVGNAEYASTASHSFPAQEAIARIAPYTDRVYCTTLGDFSDSSYHTPMNGSIRVHYDASSNESLSFSNNSTKLKDTAWFKANRTTPSAWASS